MGEADKGVVGREYRGRSDEIEGLRLISEFLLLRSAQSAEGSDHAMVME
jgi:hypothetical protein